MDKSKIVQSFLLEFENQISEQKEVLENTRKLTNDAPSARESHSDTSRFQLGNLALGQESRLREIEETARNLKNLILSPKEKVVIGAVFILCGEGQKPKNYFMFHGAQGMSIEIDGIIITAISAKSPLGVSVLGKKRGDKVRFSTFKYNIADVW